MKWPKITEDTPLSEIQKIHKRIWTWAMIFGNKPDTPYAANCVVCEYMNSRHLYGRCKACPIIWKNKYGCCHAESEYFRWQKASNWFTKFYWARKIRNISFRSEDEQSYLVKDDGITRQTCSIINV